MINRALLKSIPVLLLMLFSATAAALVDESELLDPDVAFAVSAKALNDQELEVRWQVAPGYYMYRHRINFRADNEEIELGEPVLPDGKRYNDEFFGEVETYRDSLVITIPIDKLPAGVDQFNLKARSQGCADLGVCYPPHQQIVPISLVANTAANTGPDLDAGLDAGMNAGLDGLSGLQAGGNQGGGLVNLQDALNSFSNSPQGLQDDGGALPDDQAFMAEAINLDAGTLLVRLTPENGYYLYKDKIAFASDDDSIRIRGAELPPGDQHQDEHFGAVEIYRDQVEIPVHLSRDAGPAMSFDFRIFMQGCKEKGICYPPMKRVVRIDLPATDAAIGGGSNAGRASTVGASGDAANGGAANGETSGGEGKDAKAMAMEKAGAAAEASTEQDILAGVLANSPLYAMLLFFVAGVLLAFTPCVFPMVPILSGIIAGQGDNITTRKAFSLSLVYVLVMALTYAIVGVVAAGFGKNLQALFQQPWVLWSFAILFVLLALSMFGFYNLQLPNSLQDRLTNVSNKQEGGSYIGVGIMGLLSALVVGPCVAPALMAALIYIGQTGDKLLGGLALFAMGLGMGVPLIAFGTSAGKFMPRAGGWMDAVKAFFGVGLLGLALWMLERILSGNVMMLLWSLLFLGSGVFMGALEPVPEGVSGWRRFWKATGLAILIYGVLLMVGYSAGGDDWLRPLHSLRGGVVSASGVAAHEEETHFKIVKSIDDLNAELAQGKPVMLDFYADWCVECKRMEKYTFPEGIVKERLERFTLVQADVTAFDDIDQALVNEFDLFGPPAILFFDANGDEVGNLRMIGYMDAEDFSAHLDKVINAL